MVRGILLLFIVCFISCDKQNSESEKVYTGLNVPGKLEKLLSLQQDTVLDYYDLSNDFLTEFPDLSAYSIRSLNLSYNLLDTLNLAFLPKNLDKLNLAYNVFTKFRCDSVHHLKELNLSHNFIKEFIFIYSIERLDISFNNLIWVRLAWTYRYNIPKGYNTLGREKMKDLNISNNPNLESTVAFEPDKIDTIIRNNIADGKKLIEVQKFLRRQINNRTEMH